MALMPCWTACRFGGSGSAFDRLSNWECPIGGAECRVVDQGSGYDVADIEFDAEGASLRGWLYRPQSGTSAAPVVVMAHGYNCLKEFYLAHLGSFDRRGAVPRFAVALACPEPIARSPCRGEDSGGPATG